MSKSEFQYFSQNRSLKLRFFLIFLCGFLCLTTAVAVQTGLWNKRLETARMQYGLWQGVRMDISVKDRQILNSHELLEEVGTQEIFGLLETNGLTFVTGCADGSFYKLANFSLLQGRLPERGDEIAVENWVLDRLGMAYEPGETITGTIQGSQRQFTVTGIINNYTASWISGDSQPAIFTGPGSGLKSVRDNVFIRGENSEVIDDLKQAMPLLIRNVHVKELWEPFAPENAAWSMLMVFSLGGSAFLIMVVFRKWLKSRRHDIQVLKGLGVSERKIRKDLIRTIIQAAGTAALISLTIAALMNWPLPVILGTAGALILEILTLCCLLAKDVKEIPAVENASGGDLPETQRHWKPMKRVTAFRLGLRFLESRNRSIAGNLIAAVFLASAFFGTTLALTETWQLQKWLQEKPDFILSLEPEGLQTFRTDDSLERIAEKLKEDSRFSHVESGFVQMYGWAIPVEEGSLLEQLRNDPTISNESRNSLLYPSELMAEDLRNWQMVPIISREDIDLTEVEGFDEELWNSGEGIILYAPDVSIHDGKLWLAGDLSNSIEVKSEGGYRSGDTILLQDPFGKEVKTRIAGILRKPPEWMRFDEMMGLSMAYTIYAAPDFFEYPVNRLHLTLSDEQKDEVQVSVSAIAAREAVYMTNERAIKQRVMDLLDSQETLFGVLTAALFLSLSFFILSATGRLRNQLADWKQCLILAGARLSQADKAICSVWGLLLFLLATGILLAGNLVEAIHSRFPTNGDLLGSVMPFLFVNNDAVGIYQLDHQIGLWLLPAVLGMTVVLAIAGFWVNRRNEKFLKD